VAVEVGSQSEPIHISMACDRAFLVPLGVSLLTIAEAHAREGHECAVTVLHDGLDSGGRAAIEMDVGDRLALTWQEVDLTRLTGARTNEQAGVSRAALFRLLLPELLPPELNRTIYVDADTVVCRSLGELARIDLAGNLLAAVRDATIPYAAGLLGLPWREFGVPPDMRYLNAGVAVIPLDQWRTEGLHEEMLSILRKRRFPYSDQDAINIVVRGRWLELSRRWNLQTADVSERGFGWALEPRDAEAARDDPAIVHYTEFNKPWLSDVHPLAPLWTTALARSSFAGWAHPSTTTLGKIRRRVVRARQAILGLRSR
jgi:lipopolysaccharide biosynthesis glycosyltransferase